MKHMSVSELMHKGVRTVPESMPLSDAAHLMKELGISSLVVTREHHRDAFGIVTRKDIIEAFSGPTSCIGPMLVQDVMTKPAITVEPELSLAHCMQLMRMAGIRRIPIVKNGELVGILSNADIFEWLVEHNGGEATAAE